LKGFRHGMRRGCGDFPREWGFFDEWPDLSWFLGRRGGYSGDG